MEESEIIKKLSRHPETYKSLLGDLYGRNTLTVIVRKKILRNIRSGCLGRMGLVGTRGSSVLFYACDKKYIIIIICEHRDFKYYVCTEIKKINKTTVELVNTDELVDDKWKKIGDVIIFKSNVIKVI